mmetsp:Transcript_5616/g.7855  ORF Transcript_5616/g.7855 Transcript_5616/m.7855 type:complete len:86 (-) Transcript_5616:109-366(-)
MASSKWDSEEDLDIIERMKEIEAQIRVVSVVKNEVVSLPKDREVYHKKSNIFFLSDRDHVAADKTREIQELTKEKKELRKELTNS